MPSVIFRRDHLRFTSGIICGSGSFAVQFGDHLRRCTGFPTYKSVQCSRFQTGTDIRRSRAINPRLTVVYPRLYSVYRRTGDTLQGVR